MDDELLACSQCGSGHYNSDLEKIEALEVKLKRAEDNLVAIRDVFLHAPTMRVEADKCLKFINPKKFGQR
jgi:hypothetical protein